MVAIERADPSDAHALARMEQAADAIDSIIPYAAEIHRQNILDDRFVYLRIVAEGTVGFIILFVEAGESIEFRRIVVAEKGKGIGKRAIALMEEFCRKELGKSRIWLDVFEHNARARHVYEELGYVKFGEEIHQGKRLFLLEKAI